MNLSQTCANLGGYVITSTMRTCCVDSRAGWNDSAGTNLANLSPRLISFLGHYPLALKVRSSEGPSQLTGEGSLIPNGWYGRSVCLSVWVLFCICHGAVRRALSIPSLQVFCDMFVSSTCNLRWMKSEAYQSARPLLPRRRVFLWSWFLFTTYFNSPSGAPWHLGMSCSPICEISPVFWMSPPRT